MLHLLHEGSNEAFYRIVNVASSNAVAVATNRAVYCASKAAPAAVSKLNQNDHAEYWAILDPTASLARFIVRAPTQYYKPGVVFLAWLNGLQDHFVMLGRAQAMRSLPYYCDVFRLADQCGMRQDAGLAIQRMNQLLRLYGV